MSNFIQDLLCNDLNIIQELTNLNYQARDEINQSNASLHGLTDMNIEPVDSDDLLKLIEMYKKKNEHSFKDRIELESHQNMLTIIEESKEMFSDPNNYDVIIECEKDDDGKCVYKGVSADTKNNIDELHKANKLRKPLTLLYKENSDYPIVYYDSSKVTYAYNTKSGIARNVGGALAITGLMVVGSLMAKFTSIGASSAADTIGDAIDPKGFGKAYSISSSGKIEKSRVNSGEILGTAAVAYVGKKTINQFVSIHDQMVNPLSEDASTFFKLKLLIKNCSCSKNINDTTTLEHNLMKARTEIKYSIIPKLIKVIFIGLIVATIVYFTGGLILPILLGVAKKLFMKDMNKKADNVGMYGLTYIIKTIVVTIIAGLLYAVGKTLSYGLYKVWPRAGEVLSNIYNKISYIIKKLAIYLNKIWTPNKYKILLNSLDVNSIKNDISDLSISGMREDRNKIFNEFIISKIDEWSIGEGFELAIDDDNENILTNTIQTSFAENNLNQIIKETKDQFLETLFEAVDVSKLSNEQYLFLSNNVSQHSITYGENIIKEIKINFRDCNEQNPTKSKSHLYLKLYSTFYNMLIFSYTSKSIVYTTPGKQNEITDNITSEIKGYVQTIAFKLAKKYTQNILSMALYDILHENDKNIDQHPFNVMEKNRTSQKDQIIADYNEGIAGITYNIGIAENTNPNNAYFNKVLSIDKLRKFYQSYLDYIRKLIYYKPYDARKIFANLNLDAKKYINRDIISDKQLYENGDYIFEVINNQPCITPRKVFVDERLFTGVDYEELYKTQLLDLSQSIYDNDLNLARNDLISNVATPFLDKNHIEDLDKFFKKEECAENQVDVDDDDDIDTSISDLFANYCDAEDNKFNAYTLFTIYKNDIITHEFLNIDRLIADAFPDKPLYKWNPQTRNLEQVDDKKVRDVICVSKNLLPEELEDDFIFKGNESFYRVVYKYVNTTPGAEEPIYDYDKFTVEVTKSKSTEIVGTPAINEFFNIKVSIGNNTGKEIIDKLVEKKNSSIKNLIILNNHYFLYSKLLSNHKQLDDESSSIFTAYSSGESPYKNSIQGLFNSDNIINEIEIFVDSYYTENFIEIYTDGLLDLVYKRDNMFNNYYLNDEVMEFKVRIFKYYELRSINNFVGKYFPEIIKRFETEITEGDTACHVKNIRKIHQSAFVEAKCDYLVKNLKDYKTLHPTFFMTNKDNFRKMLDIDSINRIYSIIILFYDRYIETLKFSQKYSSIKYYLYSTSYNDGLVYNFNPYYHLYYDIFTYSKYLYNYTGSSSDQNSKILNHFHEKVFTMVFQPKILLPKNTDRQSSIKNNIIQLALFYNKFNINHVFSSNDVIIDSFNNDGIFGSGERLYSESKIVNLNRTSFTNTELYNRLNNKYWLYYDSNKDRINIIINGKIDEFIEPISQGSNNTLAYRISVKNDVISFIDNFVNIHFESISNNLSLVLNDEVFDRSQLNKTDYKHALKLYFIHKVINTYSSLNTSSTETFINSNKTVLFRLLDISPFGGRDTLDSEHNENKSSDYSMIIFALKYLIFHWFFMDKYIGSDVRTSKFQHLSHVVLGIDMHEQIKDFYLFKSGKLFTNHFYIEKNANNQYVLKMVVSKHLSVLNSAYDTSNTYYNNALYEKREINKGIFKHNFDGSPLEQNVFDYIQTNFEIKLKDIFSLASGIGQTVKSRNYYTQSWKSFKLFYPKYITQTNSKINITKIGNISNKIFKNSMNKLYYILKNYTINKIPTDDIYLNTSVKLSHNIDSTHKIEISSEILNTPDDIQSYYETLLTKIDTFIGCNKINGDVGRLLYNTLILGKVIDTNFSFEPQIAYFSSINDYYDLKALPQKTDKESNYFITRYSKALDAFRKLIYDKPQNKNIDIHISGHQTGGSYSIMILYHLIYNMIKMKNIGSNTTKYNNFIKESLMLISKIKVYSVGSTKDFNYTASILLDFIEEIINLDTSYNYTSGTTVLNVMNYHDPIPKIPKIRFHMGSLYIIDSKIMNYTCKYLIELENNIYPYLTGNSQNHIRDNAYRSMLNYTKGVSPTINIKLDFSKLVSIYLKDSRFRHISKIKKLKYLINLLKNIVDSSDCTKTSASESLMKKLNDIFNYYTSDTSDTSINITTTKNIVNAIYNSFMTGNSVDIPVTHRNLYPGAYEGRPPTDSELSRQSITLNSKDLIQDNDILIYKDMSFSIDPFFDLKSIYENELWNRFYYEDSTHFPGRKTIEKRSGNLKGLGLSIQKYHDKSYRRVIDKTFWNNVESIIKSILEIEVKLIFVDELKKQQDKANIEEDILETVEDDAEQEEPVEDDDIENIISVQLIKQKLKKLQNKYTKYFKGNRTVDNNITKFINQWPTHTIKELMIRVKNAYEIKSEKIDKINSKINSYFELLVAIYNEIDYECFKINMDLYKNIRENPFIVNPVILTDLQSKLFNRRPEVFITESTQSIFHQIKFITEKSGYLNSILVSPDNKNYSFPLDNRFELDQASVFNKDNGLEFTTIDRSPVRIPDYMNILETKAELNDMSTTADIQYGNDYSYTPYLLSTLPIYQMFISKLYHDEKFIRDVRKIQKNILFSFDLEAADLENRLLNTDNRDLITIYNGKNPFKNFLKTISNPGIFYKIKGSKIKMLNTFFSKKLFDTIRDSGINIEDKYLQRIVRKNYNYRNTKGYFPSLNNTRNLFCFDTESLLDKKLTNIDDIVDFILLIGRKLGLFFEEFEFQHKTYHLLKSFVNKIKNKIPYSRTTKGNLHIENIASIWKTSDEFLSVKRKNSSKLENLENKKAQLGRAKIELEEAKNALHLVSSDDSIDIEILKNTVERLDNAKQALKDTNQELIDITKNLETSYSFGEVEANIKLNILMTFTKYLKNLGFINDFVPEYAETYQESYRKSSHKIKLMLIPTESRIEDTGSVTAPFLDELNGIDLFNITCMTADNYPCNYNLFNNNGSLSKSISVYKFFKIYFNRQNNEFKELVESDHRTIDADTVIAGYLKIPRFNITINLDNEIPLSFTSRKIELNIDNTLDSFDPHQIYMLKLNNILGKFVYNKNDEYNKYFKGDILHQTLSSAKLNNLSVLSNKKSPKFTSVHESELNQVDTEGDSDELEIEQNKVLQKIKTLEENARQAANAQRVNLVEEVGESKEQEPEDNVSDQISSTINCVDLRRTKGNPKCEEHPECKWIVREGCKDKDWVKPEPTRATRRSPRVSQGGGSLSCCKKNCRQYREEGSFFCIKHSINSMLSK